MVSHNNNSSAHWNNSARTQGNDQRQPKGIDHNASVFFRVAHSANATGRPSSYEKIYAATDHQEAEFKRNDTVPARILSDCYHLGLRPAYWGQVQKKIKPGYFNEFVATNGPVMVYTNNKASQPEMDQCIKQSLKKHVNTDMNALFIIATGMAGMALFLFACFYCYLFFRCANKLINWGLRPTDELDEPAEAPDQVNPKAAKHIMWTARTYGAANGHVNRYVSDNSEGNEGEKNTETDIKPRASSVDD